MRGPAGEGGGHVLVLRLVGPKPKLGANISCCLTLGSLGRGGPLRGQGSNSPLWPQTPLSVPPPPPVSPPPDTAGAPPQPLHTGLSWPGTPSPCGLHTLHPPGLNRDGTSSGELGSRARRQEPRRLPGAPGVIPTKEPASSPRPERTCLPGSGAAA